jgi:hypothetical protein
MEGKQMVLSKREKYILLVTLIVVTTLVADRYVVTPLMSVWAQVKAEKEGLIDQMNYAQSLFRRKALMERKWQDMISSGLERDVSKTESKVLNAVRQWSQECDFVLSSVKPERVAGQEALQQITFQVAGTGTMQSVGRLIWRIENAQLPIRIEDIQLGSRTEGVDDMSLQLKLSAIYLYIDVNDVKVEI